jgi:hypothetical protein
VWHARTFVREFEIETTHKEGISALVFANNVVWSASVGGSVAAWAVS